MKKLIALVITLMTIVTFSASAQCPSTSNPQGFPTLRGDITPCKNQKNVPYVLGNNGQPAYWCPTSGCTIVSYRYLAPPQAIISDGVKSATGTNYLYTDSIRVFVTYKSKGGSIAYGFKDNSGRWYNSSIIVNLTCEAGTGAPPTISYVDTAASVYGVNVISTTKSMTLNMDSIGGFPGAYDLQLMVEQPLCPQSGPLPSDFVTVTAAYPDFPIYFNYGWGPVLWYNQTYNAKITGRSATGQYFKTATFTLDTTVD